MREAAPLERVRIDLLVGLKMYVDEGQRIRRDAEAGVVDVNTGRVPDPENWPEWTPLHVSVEHEYEDMVLAAREAERLGEIEMEWDPIVGPSVRLTEKGYEVGTRLQWRHYPKSVRSEHTDRGSPPDSAPESEDA